MNLRCLFCGHTVALAQADGTYEGPLGCQVCKNVMLVRVERGYLRTMASAPRTGPHPAPAGPPPGRSSHHRPP